MSINAHRSVLLFLLGAHVKSGGGAPGLDFFESVLGVNLVFITIAGVTYLSTVVSEEKDEMTLGLLRMTSLSPMGLLIGKAATRLLGAMLLLLAQVPFTVLAVTLGGVTLQQIAAAYMTMLAYTFMLAGVALFCSVVFSRSSSAILAAALAVVILYVGPSTAKFLLGFMVQLDVIEAGGAVQRWGNEARAALTTASPFEQVETIVSINFGRGSVNASGQVVSLGLAAILFSKQVLTDLAIGAAFFLVSWLVFDVFTREAKEPTPGRGLLGRQNSRWGWINPGRAWRQPIIWKDFNFLTGGRAMMLAKFGGYGALITLAYLWGVTENVSLIRFCYWAKYAMLVALFGEMAWYAGRIFTEELRWQTLPSLVTLPITVNDLCWSKAIGCAMGGIPAATYVVLLTLGSWFLPGRTHDLGWEVPLFMAGATVSGIYLIYLIVYLSLRLRSNVHVAALGLWAISMVCMGTIGLLCPGGLVLALIGTCMAIHNRITDLVKERATS